MDLKQFFAAAVLGLSLFVSSTLGQGVQKIEGPTTAEPGSLVRLSAPIEDDESAFWLVLSPIDLDYEMTNGGRKMIFAAGCSSREIVVMCLAQSIEDGRIVNRPYRHVMTIGAPVEEPEDPGDDPVDDDPGAGPDFSAIAAWVSNHPTPKADPDLAIRWRDALRSSAPGLKGKTLVQAKEIVSGIRVAVFGLDDPRINWAPFFQELEAEILKNPPKTGDDYSILVEAIAKGLSP